MPTKLKWTDSEDLALALFERFPKLNPLEVRFTDLHQWVCEIPDFGDDPKASNEAKLEAIQMAWLDEWKAESE
jgi:FeS assembly protein IscX